MNASNFYSNRSKKQKFFIICLAFFILGGLYTLAFPPYNIFIFFIISICGSTLLVKLLSSFKQLIAGLVCFIAGMSIFGFYWILYAIQYIFPNPYVSFIIFIGFILLYSFMFLPTYILIFIDKNNILSIKGAWVVSIAWGMSEILKLYFINGFPWFVAAQIWDFSLYSMQVIKLIGVLGLSILTILFTISVLVLLNKNIRILTKIKYIGLWSTIFIIINLYGYYELKHNVTQSNSIDIPIRIVATSIPQEKKLDYRYNLEIFNQTLQLAFSNLDYNNPPKYIILPEVAFNFILEDYPELFNQLTVKIPKESILLIGALRQENNNYYNSLYAISGESKKVIFSYDKIRLVPFGEYIPLYNLVPFIGEQLGLVSLSAGDSNKYFIDKIKSDSAQPVIIMSPAICFEGVFELFTSEIEGFEFVLNISNEGWFKNSNEREQNISLFRLRVIESGVTGLKVANQGISVLYNSKGEKVYQKNNSSSIIFDTYLTIEKKNKINNSMVNMILILVILVAYLCLTVKKLRASNKSE